MIYQNENFGGNYVFRCHRHTMFVVEPHLHEYSELAYAVRGSIRLTVSGQSFRLPEKHLMLIPPNIVHAFPSQRCDMICGVFSNDLIPLVFREIGSRRLVPTPVDMTDIAGMVEQLPLLDTRRLARISGYLNLICNRVIEQSAFAPYHASDNLLYQKVVSYLSEQHTANITLKSVAAHFGYNEKYLSHTLHDLTGLNFRTLLCLYRVEHAKTLLYDPSCSVSRAALASGFSAVNTFNRVFKSFTGMTPSAYRRGSRV